MGLINREKRLHARPARTVTPPTLACAGVRAPRCSLVRCPSHQRPQTSGHPGALAHTCFPKVAALGPEASDSAPPRPERALARLLGPVNGVGGLTAVRPLRAMRPLGASTRPRPSGRPSPATGLAGTHARRRETLRTSRSPNRQVGVRHATSPPLLSGGVRGFTYTPRYPGRLVLLQPPTERRGRLNLQPCGPAVASAPTSQGLASSSASVEPLRLARTVTHS